MNGMQTTADRPKLIFDFSLSLSFSVFSLLNHAYIDAGHIPIGTSIMALCPQTVNLSKSLTSQPTLDKPTFESKGPPIVATNVENSKKDEKCFL